MLGICAFGRSAVQHQWSAYRAALHAVGTAPARRVLFACRECLVYGYTCINRVRNKDYA